MLIFDFSRDIKLALTITIFEEKKNIYIYIYRHEHGQDIGLSLLHYSFVMLCNEISWHDRLLENMQIVQRNLQIGQIGRLDGTYI